MPNYKLSFLGISETRWNGSGNTRQEMETYYSFFPVDHLKKKHESGEAILLSREIRCCLVEWNPVSKEISTALLSIKMRKLTLVQCYVPKGKDKEKFYDILTNTIECIEKSEIVILMGNLNAKVGSDNTTLSK